MITKTSSKTKARKRKRINCPQITNYMRLVETGKVRSHERQKKLCKYVRRVFAEEELIIDTQRIDGYSKYLKYFPFDILFPWELFLLTLFLCVFDKDGNPRWPDLICFLGRGAGKNGFIAFIAFCLITSINGIRNYDVDICANSEEQAKRSFDDIWEILEGEFRLKFKNAFKWNKEEIVSKKTRARIKYRTNSPKSKDGMRSGLVIFDEVHAYENWKNITVFTTGQGKCAHPRRAFISSNGDVCEGVFDTLLEKCDAILNGEIDDNGYLPFVCMLDSEDEVHDERNWEKANPSLPYLPVLMHEIRKEYKDWLLNPIENADFMTKHMGIRQGDKENEVATWENIVRASGVLPDLRGWSCVAGIDLSRTSDFTSVVLLFKQDGKYYVIHHTWVCKQSIDLPRIKAPLDAWADMQIVTMVDDVEIHPYLIADYIYEMQALYDIRKVAIDDYRYTIMERELRDIGYTFENKTVAKIRPADHMRVQPIINSAFLNGDIAWGDDPCMRWMTNNTKLIRLANSNGNFKYDKIEPKSRKTDGFMAFVAAMCIRDDIPEYEEFSLAEPIIC